MEDVSMKGEQQAVSTGTEATIHSSEVTTSMYLPQSTALEGQELPIRTKCFKIGVPDTASEAVNTSLDGVSELEYSRQPHIRTTASAVTPCRPAGVVLRELPYAAACSSALPSRLLSSARARRPKTRSFEDPIVIQEDKDESASTLDPGASIFTPRVRFGSTTTFVNVDSPSGRAREIHERRVKDQVPTTLTTRSTSEQNFDPRTFHDGRSTSDVSATTGRLPHATTSPASSAASSTTVRHSSDSVHFPTPNLERYPLLLSPALHGGRRRSGTSQSGYTPTRSLLTIPSSTSNSSGVSPVTQIHDSPADTGGLLGSSPLLVVGAARTPRARMVSAASGISDYEYESPARSFLSRRSSTEITDAASEFLRFRSSPLDTLTEELSRLSTALATQTTTTTPCRSQVPALLNGNPFRHSSNATLQSGDSVPSLSTPAFPHTPGPSKLPVYNDALPSTQQPQTPADFLGSTSRRARNRSDSAIHSPISPPLPASVSMRRNRNTYPSTSTGSGEDDLDGLIAGLEGERRTWLGRLGEGGLEITPPGKGRLERMMDWNESDRP
ncbi:hypothetical protein B0A48_04451 [Cryoendolithus antarcticus]|uniref:Uncharacterized protein n=1 Tax=Cryoendolithus antarcticus TaxID=1507870 RepID=A0A1V8TFN5_9PEZI|nr:hypothetical protein B0A48_04451 [Cryoendolithus antarcticus]